MRQRRIFRKCPAQATGRSSLKVKNEMMTRKCKSPQPRRMPKCVRNLVRDECVRKYKMRTAERFVMCSYWISDIFWVSAGQMPMHAVCEENNNLIRTMNTRILYYTFFGWPPQSHAITHQRTTEVSLPVLWLSLLLLLLLVAVLVVAVHERDERARIYSHYGRFHFFP